MILKLLLVLSLSLDVDSGKAPRSSNLDSLLIANTVPSAIRIYKIAELNTLDYVGPSITAYIRKNFTAEAYATNRYVLTDLASAITGSRIVGRCNDFSDQRWLLELLDRSGKVLHTMAWSSGSTCALIDGKGYSVVSRVEPYIRRTFGFLND